MHTSATLSEVISGSPWDLTPSCLHSSLIHLSAIFPSTELGKVSRDSTVPLGSLLGIFHTQEVYCLLVLAFKTRGYNWKGQAH